MAKSQKGTQKTTPARELVSRPANRPSGAGHILVVKSGEELKKNIASRLEAMQADYQTVDFFWGNLGKDSDYSEAKEWKDHFGIVTKWELQEGVRNLQDYKAWMKRLTVLRDYFDPAKDYELTVDEVVDLLSGMRHEAQGLAPAMYPVVNPVQQPVPTG